MADIYDYLNPILEDIGDIIFTFAFLIGDYIISFAKGELVGAPFGLAFAFIIAISMKIVVDKTVRS